MVSKEDTFFQIYENMKYEILEEVENFQSENFFEI